MGKKIKKLRDISLDSSEYGMEKSITYNLPDASIVKPLPHSPQMRHLSEIALRIKGDSKEEMEEKKLKEELKAAEEVNIMYEQKLQSMLSYLEQLKNELKQGQMGHTNKVNDLTTKISEASESKINTENQFKELEKIHGPLADEALLHFEMTEVKTKVEKKQNKIESQLSRNEEIQRECTLLVETSQNIDQRIIQWTTDFEEKKKGQRKQDEEEERKRRQKEEKLEKKRKQLEVEKSKQDDIFFENTQWNQKLMNSLFMQDGPKQREEICPIIAAF